MAIEGNGDDFAAAFTAAANTGGDIPAPGDAPPATEPGAAPPADASVSADAPPAAGEGAGDTPAPGDAGGTPAPAEGGGDAAAPAGTPEPAAAPPAAPAAPAAAPTADDIVKSLAEALKQQPPAPAPAAAPTPDAPQAPLYTDEETGILTEYEKNWPDVAKAETLKRRAEYHDLLKYVFTQVNNFISPLNDQLRTIGNTMHLGELKQAVPDYSENLEDEVLKWVDTQPAYLQQPYKQVMQGGTSDEVADLIRRYRESTGAASAPAPAAAAAAPTPTPTPPAQTELSSAAKQAAASLAPVSAERSAVPQGEDPQDFASAFAKYAATMPT